MFVLEFMIGTDQDRLKFKERISLEWNVGNDDDFSRHERLRASSECICRGWSHPSLGGGKPSKAFPGQFGVVTLCESDSIGCIPDTNLAWICPCPAQSLLVLVTPPSKALPCDAALRRPAIIALGSLAKFNLDNQQV